MISGGGAPKAAAMVLRPVRQYKGSRRKRRGLPQFEKEVCDIARSRMTCLQVIRVFLSKAVFSEQNNARQRRR